MAHHEDLDQSWEIINHNIYNLVVSTPGGRRDSVKSLESDTIPSEHTSFSEASSVCQWSPSTPEEIIPMDFKMPMQQYSLPQTPMSKFGPVLPSHFVSPTFDFPQSYEPKRMLPHVQDNRNDTMHSSGFSFAQNLDATAFNQPNNSCLTTLSSQPHMRICNTNAPWLHHEANSHVRDLKTSVPPSLDSPFGHSGSPDRWNNYTSPTRDTVNPWHVGGVTRRAQQHEFEYDDRDHATSVERMDMITDDEYEFIDTTSACTAKYEPSPASPKPKTTTRQRRKASKRLSPNNSGQLGYSCVPKKNNICEICNARFERREHLKRHQKSHSNDKPFTCSLGPGDHCKIYNKEKTKGKTGLPGISRSDNQGQHYKTHLKKGRNTCYGPDYLFWIIRKYEGERAEKLITMLTKAWKNPNFPRGQVDEEKLRKHRDYPEYARENGLL